MESHDCTQSSAPLRASTPDDLTASGRCTEAGLNLAGSEHCTAIGAS
jgi:hypothetical protein